jgi:hypothetical protein
MPSLSSSLTDELTGISCEIGPLKQHESRTAVVSPAGAATPRQLVMFIVDKVVEEDRRMLVNELESITLPETTTRALRPTVHGAFATFEDL